MDKNRAIEDIRAIVRRFILENYLFGYEEGELQDDMSLLEMGAIDSTGIIELVVFMEENFHIQVINSEILPENLDSIDSICSYIYKKQIAA